MTDATDIDPRFLKADLEDVTDLRSLTEIIRLASARKAALQGTEA